MQDCNGTIPDQSYADDVENELPVGGRDGRPRNAQDGHSIQNGSFRCVCRLAARTWDEFGSNLLAKCTSEAFHSIPGSKQLTSRIQAELERLECVAGDERTLNSSNLPYLNAVVLTSISASGVTGFMKIFWYESSGHQQEASRRRSVAVDVVCNGGSRWIKVSARNPHALHRHFLGQERHGGPDIVAQTEALICASKQNLKGYNPPDVVCYFNKGVTDEVRRALFRLGASVIGDKVDSQITQMHTECHPGCLSSSGCQGSDVNVSVPDISPELRVMPQILNLDVTALLACVSEITNGSTFTDFTEDVLRLQASEEILDPVLPVLYDKMRGKVLIACQSAISAFKTILETIGGPNEKERAEQLLGQIQIVDDSVSDRVSRLTQSSHIKSRSKAIFGTGDSKQAVTVTANASFVRAAAQQGVELCVFLHSPRALTESKEAAKQKSKDVLLFVSDVD